MRRWLSLTSALLVAGSVSHGQETSPPPPPTETGQAVGEDREGPGLDPLQRLYRHNRRGNRAFSEGDLAEAQREYVEAQGLAPDDPRVLYNLGNTLASQGKVEDALATLERAAEGADDRSLERDARFNSGLLQMGQQDLQGALRSFGRALTLDPGDDEARRNLELVLRQIQQQQQEQQQQQGQQGDQGEEDQQDQQNEQQQEQQEQQQDQQRQEQEQQDEQQRDQQQENQERQQPGEQQQGQQERPQQDEQERDAQQEAARRLLKALENEEKEALKKALRQKLPDAPDRKEDW